MDKKNEVKEKPEPPKRSYVPRKDYGDITEDEALEIHRNMRENDAWQNSYINTLYRR